MIAVLFPLFRSPTSDCNCLSISVWVTNKNEGEGQLFAIIDLLQLDVHDYNEANVNKIQPRSSELFGDWKYARNHRRRGSHGTTTLLKFL